MVVVRGPIGTNNFTEETKQWKTKSFLQKKRKYDNILQSKQCFTLMIDIYAIRVWIPCLRPQSQTNKDGCDRQQESPN